MRVHSVLASKIPRRLHLELRVHETLVEASIDAKTVGEASWEKAQKLTPESIVRSSGSFDLTSSGVERSNISNGDSANSAASAAAFVAPFTVAELFVIAYASPDLASSFLHRLSGRDGQQAPGLEERLNSRILDVRSAAEGAIFKLHSGLCQLAVEFLCSHGFHWIHTPHIITARIAGDNEYFHLPYFGRDAWPAQSTQHHKQMALAVDMHRVFEIGPVFRAEVKSSGSARHLTEVSQACSSCFFRQT